MINKLFRRTAAPLPVLPGYALWAKCYPAQAHNPLMVAEEEAMMSLLPVVDGATCLDLACGSGRYINLLRERGAELVVGSDISPDMLAQSTDAELVQASFNPLPFADDQFDLVTCALAVGHVRNLDAVIGEAARVLKRGGVLLYSDIHPQGTEAGWQRSFDADGRKYHVEHYLHTSDDHDRACRAAGLTIDIVLEPKRPEMTNLPLIIAIQAVKH